MFTINLPVVVNLTRTLAATLICSGGALRLIDERAATGQTLQSSTINLPRTIFIAQLNVNVPARSGVN